MRFFDWIIETSWQASILALCIFGAQTLFAKRMAAQWRYRLWLLLVLRLLLPSLPPAPVSVFNLTQWKTRAAVSYEVAMQATQVRDAAIREPILAKIPANPERAAAATLSFAPLKEVSRPFPWKRLTVCLWLSGACYFGLRLTWTNVRFARRLRALPQIEAGEAFAELQLCVAQLKLRPPILLETDFVAAPCIYGLFRKRILLPSSFAMNFSRNELRQILLHELGHIRRGDIAVNWLVACVQVLHWFNPLLWLAFTRMRWDRELATDAFVLKIEGSSRAEEYGEAILKVLAGFKTNSGFPQLVGIIESKVRLKERFRAIAGYGMIRPSAGLSLALVCGLVCFTLTGAVEQKQSRNAEVKPVASTATGVAGKTLFVLHITDTKTKKSSAGITVKVQLQDYEGNSSEKFITTDTEGRASVEIPTTGLKSVSYQTQSPDFVVLDGIWRDDEIPKIPSPVEIEMLTGIEIGGTIIDDAAKPIAGAQIYFNKPGSLSGINRSGTRYTLRPGQLIATSDNQGVWKAEHIYPTWPYLNLRVRHPDYADEVFCTELAESKQPESVGRFASWLSFTNKTASLALEKGISLKGQILDPSGKGVPLTPIKYSDRKLSLDWHATLMGESTILSDTEGRFQIAHLPRKHIFFSIQTPTSAPEAIEYDPMDPAAPKELAVQLKKGSLFTGTVKDPSGQPVPDVRVRFGDWSVWQGVQWEQMTDAQGKFSWDHAPEAKFMLVLSKPGFLETSKIVQGGEEKEIRVSRTLHLFGDIIDASTKAKIPRFRMAWTDNDTYWPFVKNVSGSNGVYSLDLARLYTDHWSGNYFHRFMLRIEADGYEPAKSRLFESRNDSGDLKFDFALKPSRLTGLVLDPDGRPAQGAQVALKSPNARLRLAGKPRFEKFDELSIPETGTDGSFVLSRDPEATHLVIVHEKGFGLVEAKELRDNIEVKLQKWGSLEGTVRQYDTPLADEGVNLSSPMLQGVFPHHPIQFLYIQTQTDSQGRYDFNYLPPGKISVCRMIKIPNGWTSGPYEHIDLAPGETAHLDLGGKGRQVIGRFKIKNPFIDIDVAQVSARASSTGPKPPENLKTHEELKKWSEQPEIVRAQQNIKSYAVSVSKDGSFKIEEVIPGKYRLSAEMLDPRSTDALAYNKQIINHTVEFEVPPGADSAPLNVGTFELPLKGQPGQKNAPDLAAINLDDRPVKLTDYRGKYVLLDFWATWCGPCIAELPYLRKVHERFGPRKDFAIISVSFDKTTGDLHKFVEKNKMPWTQWYLPEPSRAGVESAYESHGIPALFLIDPQGKIVKENLEGVNLLSDLQTVLEASAGHNGP
jgi:beta-lactamase regulating signal transducer with metallopeptidase domain/thiol-disulfide isomerase/thioredoxin